MKSLNNYTAPGDLGVAVGDTVRLYLDTVVHPGLPEFISATVKYPIVPVNCGSETSYSFEYDEADLLGVVALLVVADVVDVAVVAFVLTQSLIEETLVDKPGFVAEIGAATSAQGALANTALQDASQFATAAQGALADTALQPTDFIQRATSYIVPVENQVINVPANTDFTIYLNPSVSIARLDFIFSAGVDGQMVLLVPPTSGVVTIDVRYYFSGVGGGYNSARLSAGDAYALQYVADLASWRSL